MNIGAQIIHWWQWRVFGPLHGLIDLGLDAGFDLSEIGRRDRGVLMQPGREALERVAAEPGRALVSGVVLGGVAPRMAGARISTQLQQNRPASGATLCRRLLGGLVHG